MTDEALRLVRPAGRPKRGGRKPTKIMQGRRLIATVHESGVFGVGERDGNAVRIIVAMAMHEPMKVALGDISDTLLCVSPGACGMNEAGTMCRPCEARTVAESVLREVAALEKGAAT